jgi:hypothetical protein
MQPVVYGALHAEIESDGNFAGRLETIKATRANNNEAAVEQILHQLDNDSIGWLKNKNPVRIDLLTTFLKTCGSPPWSAHSWAAHRGNLSRYMVLLDYYQRLFAP